VKKITLPASDVLVGLSLIAALSIHPVAAQEATPTPAPQASQTVPLTFHLEVDQADLAAISNALMELPKKVADPIINKLNAQLAKQMEARKPPEPKQP
jgi:hypothetical protein